MVENCPAGRLGRRRDFIGGSAFEAKGADLRHVQYGNGKVV
jgi:hypothetical protein